jgi:hypothetical protein
MDQEHIARLRNPYDETNPGLPLVLYLDLPPAIVEEWLSKFCTVMALNRRVSQVIVELLDAAGDGEGDGLEDTAARSLNLLTGMSVDQQAFLVPLLESLIQMNPTALAGHNADCTESESRMREVRRRIIDDHNAPSAAQEAQQPLLPTNPLPTVEEVLRECAAILRREDGANDDHR